MQKRFLVNNQIRADRVRVINEDGKQIGILSRQEALRLAQEKGRDLVQVTENVNPPVCKIVDWGKFLYLEKKKFRQKTAHKRAGEIKGLRLSFSISEHDLETARKKAKKFLEKGFKVKIEMILKGRQKALENYAKEKVERFLEKLKEEINFKRETDLKRQGPRMTIIITKK